MQAMVFGLGMEASSAYEFKPIYFCIDAMCHQLLDVI
jgi:hypothetical protein